MNKQLLRPLLLIALLTGLLSIKGSAQLAGSNAVPASVNQPTANGEALGKYGSFPVGFYTGQPNINVPLHTVNYNGITIPIALNYDASGIRVDQYPTWVGLGFSLQSGGAITRRVQGMPDDYIFPDGGNQYGGTEKGYLFCGNKLNLADPDWYSQPTLYNFALYGAIGNWNPNYLADGCPDDFNFNVGGYSGSFFLDQTGTWRVKSKSNLGIEVQHEVNSTPFLFESCGNSSPITMYINKLITKFVITTPDGNKYTFGGDVNSMDYSRAAQDNFNAFQNNPTIFNITATAWYLTKIQTPTGAEINLTYEKGLNLIRHNRSVTAVNYNPSSYSSTNNTNQVGLYSSILTPCYLKTIETPNEKLDFNRSYATEQTYSSIGVDWIVGVPPEPVSYNTLAQYEGQMFNLSVPFSNQYPLFRGWPDFSCPKYLILGNTRPRPSNPMSNQRIPNWNYQLDSINVTDKRTNLQIKNIAFTYTNSESLRLFLQEVTTSTTNTGPLKYSFNYTSPELVPNYNALTKDQWGYNNGNNYAQDPYKYDPFAGRLSNASTAAYGVLNKITFPTGGYTQFEYELNDYSKYQAVALAAGTGATGSTSLVTVNNTNAGGLRIKKISSTANYSAPVVTKEYFYKKNYATGGSTSSGILSGINQYNERYVFMNPCTGSLGYSQAWSDNAFLPWGESDIKNITYSEVAEKNNDGSFTVYKYTNYENIDCLDEVHLQALVLGATQSEAYQLSSNEIERGLLLQEANYNNLNNKVSEKIYEYDYDPDRKQQYAKCVRRRDNLKVVLNASNYWWIPACYEQAIFRLYPYKKYYYNIPLKKVTESFFETTGTITQVSSFSYDQYGNTVSTVTNTSDGMQRINAIKYNSHADYQNTALSANAIGLRKLFTDFKIKNYPVEQLTLITPQPIGGGGTQLGADRIIGGSINVYDQNNPVIKKIYGLELAESFQPITYNGALQPVYHFDYSKIDNGNFVFDSRFKLQTTINSYTSFPPGIIPRPLSVTSKSGNIAYTWDYLTQYQTSTTKNALSNEVAFTSFEGSYTSSGANDDNKGNWSFNTAYIVPNSFTGYKSLDISIASISSINTLASGKTYYVSFWGMGTGAFQLKLGTTLLNQMYAPVKTAGNWSMYRIKVVGNGGQLTILKAAGQSSFLIDEVRVYPESALMSSYNYDPVTGNIISYNDEKDNVTFYKYDFLSRMTSITDENGNIISKQTYQLQGPQ